jgi:Na+/proline symporter/nitrogen-specific signal transduction histidine kinase
MISPALVVGASVGYLLLLYGVAWWADRRGAAGQTVIDNPWVYALSMAVYCTAWTYFGSIGRAATQGMWFMPIYLGPTLAMMLGWVVLRRMLRVARSQGITSIADFIASRYGKSPLLAALVSLIAVVGIVPYIALQLKAIAAGYGVLTGAGSTHATHWSTDTAFYVALLLAGFTMVFGVRHLSSSERHEGMVAAIAFESIVKLLAFLAVGVFVVWGVFDGLGQIFERAQASERTRRLLTLDSGGLGASQWFSLTLLSGLSVLLLPRQFQVMVVENVRERHLNRALWVFPLYMLLINLFVLPVALAGLMLSETAGTNPDYFILSLPLAGDAHVLALLAFIGGLSAATGMVIVEAIAVSTMVSNDLLLPLVLRWRQQQVAAAQDLTAMLLGIRRATVLGVLLLGYVYYHLAGEAYALVSIGLISFAAVAQFAPALLGGMFWKGGTRLGALMGLSAGCLMWVYTLMLPSLVKSGWLFDMDWLTQGPLGWSLLRPEQLLGLAGMDPLTHSLFWSLLLNIGAYVVVSLWRAPSGAEASQALLFVDVMRREGQASPVFWRGRTRLQDLRQLSARFLGAARTHALLQEHARQIGVSSVERIVPDARLVQRVETQLAGAVGSASARVLVASVAQEETLSTDDVLSILDEASQLRSYSRELEAKSQSLQQATDELRRANEQLKSLDRLKDDFMSSVTHELRTPLTSIRALAELMRDDPDMPQAQRAQFVGIVVAEAERLSRLVNQVLDLAKIESGHAEWVIGAVDLRELAERAALTLVEPLRERGIALTLDLPDQMSPLQADADRLLQVLLNLLSNAAKFVPQPGGRISLQLHTDAQGLQVCVRDNGPGVPPEQRELIFEKFRQGGADDHRPQGTGLGLPISREIVSHFGGRLWLAPDDGPGACFCFELPWTAPAAREPAREDSP